MWKELTDNQKEQYKKYCDSKYGKTFIFCETGEPLYMTNEGLMIDTKIVIDILFKNYQNN